jgi:hypothetical protein
MLLIFSKYMNKQLPTRYVGYGALNWHPFSFNEEVTKLIYKDLNKKQVQIDDILRRIEIIENSMKQNKDHEWYNIEEDIKTLKTTIYK